MASRTPPSPGWVRPTRPWTAPLLVASVVAAACATSAPRATDPPGPATVYVVRHAEAWKNVAAPPAGAEPDSLTPTGEAQADALGRWLAARGGADVVVSSDTGRTRATAAAIGRALGVEPTIAPAFAGLRGGEWSWRTSEWAAGRDPRPEGGGESMADGAARARAAVEDLARGRRAVVVVTHGDVVAALLGEAAGTPAPERWRRHEVPAGSVSVLRVGPDGWALTSQGDVPALDRSPSNVGGR